MKKIFVFIMIMSLFLIACKTNPSTKTCEQLGGTLHGINCPEDSLGVRTKDTDKSTICCVPDDKLIDGETDDFCETDTDCVPLPGCHPRECINIAFEGNYEKPEACTLMFDNEAAYNPEDCVCTKKVCRNKNIVIKFD